MDRGNFPSPASSCAPYIPANIYWSLRRLENILQDMSWRRFQNVFSAKIFRLPRRLENVLEDQKLLCWRRLEDVFKMSSRRFQGMFSRCIQDVFKTCLQHVLKTSWRQTKCLLEISASKKSKSVSDKSISHLYISGKLRGI